MAFLLLTAYAPDYLNKTVLLVAVLGFYVGFVEFKEQVSLDILRDDIVPVAEKIRESGSDHGAVLSFDAVGIGTPTSDEMPALASHPVVWAPHQRVFPGISSEENLERYFTFIFLQGRDESWLRDALIRNEAAVVHGVFGWGRGEGEVLGGKAPIRLEEIDEMTARYHDFESSFNESSAAKYPVTFVVVHELAKDSVDVFDRYYEREFIGKYKKYLLFRARLRTNVS